MTDGQTDRRIDRRTDRRTDGGDCNIPDAFLKKRGDKYAIVFASMQLRIARIRKYPIDPKAYLGRWRWP